MGKVKSELAERKAAVETLGKIAWLEQRILLKALEVMSNSAARDAQYRSLIAATALALDAEFVALDVKHYREIRDVKVTTLQAIRPSGPKCPICVCTMTHFSPVPSSISLTLSISRGLGLHMSLLRNVGK